MLAADILRRTTNRNPVIGIEGLHIFREQNEENVKRSGELSDQAKKSMTIAAGVLAAIAPDLINGDQEQVEKKLKFAAIGLAAGFALRKLEEHRMTVDAHLHDSPHEREALVGEYVQSFYGAEAVMVAAPTANFSAAKGTIKTVTDSLPTRTAITLVDFKKVGAEVDGYVATEAAKTAMAKGNIAEARKQIDLALMSPIKATVDVQLVAGGIAQAEGNQDAAIGHFRAVLATGHNAVHVFLSIVASQRLKGDNLGALKTVADGVAKTGQLSAFIVEQIDIHRFLKDHKAVAADLEACLALKDIQLASLCQQTATLPDIAR